MKNDESRETLLKIILTNLEKAIVEKEFMVINLILKEIHVIYELYNIPSIKSDSSSSFAVFA